MKTMMRIAKAVIVTMTRISAGPPAIWRRALAVICIAKRDIIATSMPANPYPQAAAPVRPVHRAPAAARLAPAAAHPVVDAAVIPIATALASVIIA
jgi:hypothetical protein